MKYLHKKRQQGSLKWIIIIIIAIVVASYFFDFSVQDAVEDEQTQSNFSYIQTETNKFYTEHLKKSIDYFWNDIFIDLIWDSFKGDLEKLKAGEMTAAQEAGPGIDLNL